MNRIPIEVYGNPVRYFAKVDPPMLPDGYSGGGNLEPTEFFLISISDEGSLEDEQFWITCLGVSGKLMGGEMTYTLNAAKDFPSTEFGLLNLEWIAIDDVDDQ